MPAHTRAEPSRRKVELLGIEGVRTLLFLLLAILALVMRLAQ